MIEFIVDGVGVVRCDFGIFVDVVVEPFANLKRDNNRRFSNLERAICVQNEEGKTYSRNGINKHSHDGHGRNIH